MNQDIGITLSGLVNVGRVNIINGRIALDGRVIAVPGEDNSQVPALEYGANGFSTYSSPLNGRRSRGVDQLITWAIRNNYQDLADRTTGLHVVLNGPDGVPDTASIGEMSDLKSVTTKTLDPARDALAEDPAKAAQARANVHHLMGQLWGQGFGNSIDTLNADYRGGPEGSIPRVMVGNVQNAADRRPWTIQSGSPPKQAFDLDVNYKPYFRRTAARMYPNPNDLQAGETVDNVAAYTDHVVYDLLVDTTDDRAPTAMWRSYYQSLGLDPPAYQP